MHKKDTCLTHLISMAACKGGRGDPKALATTDAEDNPHKAHSDVAQQKPFCFSAKGLVC